MKNIKSQTARRVGISLRYLDYLLAGERNAASGTARALQRATGIAREVWVFGTPAQRIQEWNRFLKKEKQA